MPVVLMSPAGEEEGSLLSFSDCLNCSRPLLDRSTVARINQYVPVQAYQVRAANRHFQVAGHILYTEASPRSSQPCLRRQKSRSCSEQAVRVRAFSPSQRVQLLQLPPKSDRSLSPDGSRSALQHTPKGLRGSRRSDHTFVRASTISICRATSSNALC
jgi:hypothetical protein